MMKVMFTVSKVVVLTGQGADKVTLFTTDAAPTCVDELLGLDFNTAAGQGYAYVTKVLKINPALVEAVRRAN